MPLSDLHSPNTYSSWCDRQMTAILVICLVLPAHSNHQSTTKTKQHTIHHITRHQESKSGLCLVAVNSPNGMHLHLQSSPRNLFEAARAPSAACRNETRAKLDPTPHHTAAVCSKTQLSCCSISSSIHNTAPHLIPACSDTETPPTTQIQHTTYSQTTQTTQPLAEKGSPARAGLPVAHAHALIARVGACKRQRGWRI